MGSFEQGAVEHGRLLADVEVMKREVCDLKNQRSKMDERIDLLERKVQFLEEAERQNKVEHLEFGKVAHNMNRAADLLEKLDGGKVVISEEQMKKNKGEQNWFLLFLANPMASKIMLAIVLALFTLIAGLLGQGQQETQKMIQEILKNAK